jgi:DREV methyltransferase
MHPPNHTLNSISWPKFSDILFQWYLCNLQQVEREDLRQSFVQLSLDDDTERFLELSTEKSEQIILQAWHNLVSTLLKWFLTRTSINGYAT